MLAATWLMLSTLLYSLQLSTGSFPKPLTEEEERRYLSLAQAGDPEARNILIERNLRLVAHIMKKYYTQTADQEDLISIGTIGLIKGISTFDASKGARLATYAARCVENAILTPTTYGKTKIDVYFEGDTAWLSKAQMAELFQRDRSVISRHIRNVFDEGELNEKSNVQKMHIANSDKPVEYYSLDVIISVGYRVKSLRGTQFRIWANTILKEYMIKGFAMNDDLLKKSGGGNYFDELLERIRDIRSSEKVFWRKVLDIYATSVDYSANAEESILFFKTVQNKMLYAATGMTAAELVSGRANALLPMMGMTVIKGKRPTLAEAKTAKNYLNEDELGTPNRLVSAYLDLAELQAMRKKPMYMKDWIARLDDYLRMTDSEVLQNAGSVSHALAEQKAKQEYQKYKQIHSGDLTPVEQAFLESVEATAKRLEGK